VLLLGFAFKENCPDFRNTKVVDVLNALKAYNINVDVHDPWVDPCDARSSLGIELKAHPDPASYDAAVLAVAHQEFVEMGAAGIREFLKTENVLFDVKHVLEQHQATARL
jgi:UDP-N-acetyl-D-galactosamine dehydrogenase